MAICAFVNLVASHSPIHWTTDIFLVALKTTTMVMKTMYKIKFNPPTALNILAIFPVFLIDESVTTAHTNGIQEKAVKYGKVGNTINMYSSTDPLLDKSPVGTRKK